MLFPLSLIPFPPTSNITKCHCFRHRYTTSVSPFFFLPSPPRKIIHIRQDLTQLCQLLLRSRPLCVHRVNKTWGGNIVPRIKIMKTSLFSLCGLWWIFRGNEFSLKIERPRIVDVPWKWWCKRNGKKKKKRKHLLLVDFRYPLIFERINSGKNMLYDT